MNPITSNLKNSELCAGCPFLLPSNNGEGWTTYECLKEYFIFRNSLGRRPDKCIEENV